MQVHLAPEVVERVNTGKLRSEWGPIARRVKAQEGRWQVVAITDRSDRGICDEVRSRLSTYGVKAQVVALRGLGAYPRPWLGWCVYARIPPAKGDPGHRLTRN